MKILIIILGIIVVFLLLLYREMGKIADELEEHKDED